MEKTLLYYSFLSLLSLLCIFKFMLRRQHQNLPPSPFGFPITGHLHLLKPPLHRTLHSLSQKHGPIFSLQFGTRRVLIVSSPKAVEECFTRNDVVFANRPRFTIGNHLAYNCTTLPLASYGDHWRHIRRLAVHEIFSTDRLNSFWDTRKGEVKLLLQKLYRVSSLGFVKVELKTMFNELTFNIIMRMVAGKRYYGDDVDDLEEAMEFREIMREIVEFGGASNPADFLPVLRWIDYGGLETKLMRLGEKADGFLQRLVDEHRSSSNKEGAGLERKNTMIGHLLSLQELEPDNYTDTTIKGFALTLLIAGTENTAVTLEWAMSLLLNHPKVLKKARAELDNEIGHDSLLDEPYLPKLHYLQSIITETLRLFPVLPTLIAHMSSENCLVGGFDVPRDTMLLVNAWSLHTDPKVWDEPTSFKPERFDRGDEDKTQIRLIPFGMGRRTCPGSGLAKRVVGLALGSLIQCFEWERVSDEKVDLTEGNGITMPKAEPLEAMCKARQIMNKAFSPTTASV